jgi:shikimate 5-dehydrogenase
LKRTDNPDTLPAFNNLIDLPYGKQTTTLVRRAIRKKLDYIDGFVFWKWQAKAQAEFFGLEPGFKDYLDILDLHNLDVL